jgi:acetyl-CoA carboxylase biotin carboxyl carrier protein
MKILAEVAGKVWKIEARPGAKLGADEVILILESMKMEIPVTAPSPCTLVELRVKEGDMVEEGGLIAIAE